MIGPRLESIALGDFCNLGENDVRIYDRKTGKEGTMIGWLTLSNHVAVCWDFNGRVQEVHVDLIDVIH